MAITTRDKLGRIKRLHRIVLVECSCGVKFETTQDRINSGRGKFCSKPCSYKYRKQVSYRNGKYSAIHKWISKHYGQSMQCEKCGFKSNNPYQIHWANLDGEYSRDISTWARLCAKCHWHLDREGT